jgi:hypothetical protein
MSCAIRTALVYPLMFALVRRVLGSASAFSALRRLVARARGRCGLMLGNARTVSGTEFAAAAAREHRARPSAGRARHRHRDGRMRPAVLLVCLHIFNVRARQPLLGFAMCSRCLVVCRLGLIHQLFCAAVEQVEECKPDAFVARQWRRSRLIMRTAAARLLALRASVCFQRIDLQRK